MQPEFFHVIYNPAAGSGNAKKVWAVVSDALATRSVRYALYESQYPRHTVQLATQIAKANPTEGAVLLVIGGDGTLNEAISGLHLAGLQNVMPVAYIPGGSGNDFARGIGLSRKPLEALDQILSATAPLRLDIGAYTEHVSGQRGYFVNNFGIGFDAAIVNAANNEAGKNWLNRLHLGSLTYVAKVVSILSKRRPFPVDVRLNGQVTHVEDAYLCTTTNHPYFGGGVRILPSATPTDGQLDLIIVDRPNLVTFVSQAVQSIMGRPIKQNTRHHLHGTTFEVATASHEFAQVDGEDWREQRYNISFGVEEQLFWIAPAVKKLAK